MKKTERLFRILDILSEGQSATVDDLAATLKVSSRTIFRDIRNLADMSLPVVNNGGYSLSREPAHNPTSLTPEEAEILTFTLQANPLVEIPEFRRKLSAITRKLSRMNPQGGLGRRPPSLSRLCSVDHSGGSRRNRETGAVTLFWRWIGQRRRVRLTLNATTGGAPRVLFGRAERIQWRDGRWRVGIRSGSSGRVRYCSTHDIASLTPAPE
ncbi:MAG: HTH domain-containing protein [Candidatus Zixiibacteriota bacterium]